ncbi:MAG: TrmH family RNA methyltransferase [Bacilli bacterium]
MEIKLYKKEFTYSYSLGAFPTIELLKHRKEQVIKVLVHSSFSNLEVLNIIKEYGKDISIEVNDKLINKLSLKDNVYIIGIFNKYTCLLDHNSNHVLLDNPSNMGNFGTILRSSLGFGISNVGVIKPGIDIFDPKVIRASMGAIFSMNIAYFQSSEEYIDAYSEASLYSFMLQAKTSLADVKFTPKYITLVFGNEATGLDKKYLSKNSIIIKHESSIDSLNLPNAVSIALYQLYSTKK